LRRLRQVQVGEQAQDAEAHRDSHGAPWDRPAHPAARGWRRVALYPDDQERHEGRRREDDRLLIRERQPGHARRGPQDTHPRWAAAPLENEQEDQHGQQVAQGEDFGNEGVAPEAR